MGACWQVQEGARRRRARPQARELGARRQPRQDDRGVPRGAARRRWPGQPQRPRHPLPRPLRRVSSAAAASQGRPSTTWGEARARHAAAALLPCHPLKLSKVLPSLLCPSAPWQRADQLQHCGRGRRAKSTLGSSSAPRAAARAAAPSQSPADERCLRRRLWLAPRRRPRRLRPRAPAPALARRCNASRCRSRPSQLGALIHQVAFSLWRRQYAPDAPPSNDDAVFKYTVPDDSLSDSAARATPTTPTTS